MNYFCTYFDQNYLARGLTLFRSLKVHASPFVLWVLCLDPGTYDYLCHFDHPSLVPIRLEELEANVPALLNAKQNRSRAEYYFTLTPILPLFVLNHFPDVNLVTYLDADLFFYSDPAPIYDELAANSILIIEQRFTERHRWMEFSGIYNVGFLSFRNDAHGRECLEWWREQCLAWCYDRVEDGRYADQKYLDDWPTRFKQVVVLKNKGANLAPWNLDCFRICSSEGRVLVDSDPLIFYHFHWLKMLNPSLFDSHVRRHGNELTPLVTQKIYGPYLRELKSVIRHVGPQTNQSIRQDPGSRQETLWDSLLYGDPLLVAGPLTLGVGLPFLGSAYSRVRKVLGWLELQPA